MKKYCNNCGKEVEVKVKERLDTVHKAEMRCSICNKWLGWLPKDKNENKRKSQNSEVLRKQVKEFHKLDKEICFICNRNKERLNDKEVLTIDHILPLEFGGKDEIENMQILCSACHSHKNWMITYFYKHISPQETKGSKS